MFPTDDRQAMERQESLAALDTMMVYAAAEYQRLEHPVAAKFCNLVRMATDSRFAEQFSKLMEMRNMRGANPG